MKKIICMIVALCIMLSVVPISAEDYVYTTDGRVYSLKNYSLKEADIKKCVYSSMQEYLLMKDNTLWVKSGNDMVYITDNVKDFEVNGKTYAVIKYDNSLWAGEFGWSDMTKVTDNVKTFTVGYYEVFCITEGNTLYKWNYVYGETDNAVSIIMEDVESFWSKGDRYYATQTDGSFWGWGRNMIQYTPPGYGSATYTMDSLLGLGDEYKEEYEIKEPVQLKVNDVCKMYWYEYKTAVITKNGDVYYWGDRSPVASGNFGAGFEPSGTPVKTIENACSINGQSVLTNDGKLYAAFWHTDAIIAENVRDVEESLLITNEGKLYRWSWTSYLKAPYSTLTLVCKNVNGFLDKDSRSVLCLGDDTTLFEVKIQSGDKKSIAANVHSAFYYDGNMYFIDNAYALYKVDDNMTITKVFDSIVKEYVPISILVNGEKLDLDVEPYIKNDRTMVPMRAIFEALGAEVSWDNETRTAIGVKAGVEVKITIGENVLYKNGEAIELDSVAEITNDRTMVPVRAISEAFDYLVEWDNEAKIVNILDPYRRTYYTYDEDGQVIKTQNSPYPYHHEYLYDEEGNVIREWQRTAFKNSDRLFEYTYNEKGQRVSKSECTMWHTYGLITEDVPFEEVEKYFYDEEGRLSYAEYPTGGRRYCVYENDKLIREENGEGKIVKKYVYNEDGRINYTESY